MRQNLVNWCSMTQPVWDCYVQIGEKNNESCLKSGLKSESLNISSAFLSLHELLLSRLCSHSAKDFLQLRRDAVIQAGPEMGTQKTTCYFNQNPSVSPIILPVKVWCNSHTPAYAHMQQARLPTCGLNSQCLNALWSELYRGHEKWFISSSRLYL